MSNTIDHLMNDAKTFLNEANSILSDILRARSGNDDLSDEEKILTIQLTLEYRLSCEDALNLLLKLDHNLLYFLGVQDQQSVKTKRDRLAYAIGNEDLKQILTSLSLLTGALIKLVSRYKNTHTSFKLKDKTVHKTPLRTKELSQLLLKQKQFTQVLQQLDSEIEQLIKSQAGEPIFDYIAAIRGPISHFHQAVIHGLEQAKQLYHQVNKTPVIDHQLNALIKETTQVLHLMPSTFNPHPNESSKQLEHSMTSEQLEQRAAAKRLRPFFG